MLSLGLWLGGILFLGAVSAPGIFRFLRAQGQEALAPQLVGVLVARFAPVALAFGILALVGWVLEKGLTRREAQRQSLWRTLWIGQGAGVMTMLGLALYLNFGALPQLLRDQQAVIQESKATGTALSARGTENKSPARLRFDALHENYSRLTMIIFWLGAASLGAFATRISLGNNPKLNDL